MHYDLITQIRNGMKARKASIEVPHSNMDFAILRILEQKKYIIGFEKRMVAKKPVIEIRLGYHGTAPAITGAKMISTPSRHLYRKAADLHAVRQGRGIGILSTPQGILSHTEARKANVGGEYLLEIW
jgi:small subunit ribosomal protein S8